MSPLLLLAGVACFLLSGIVPLLLRARAGRVAATLVFALGSAAVLGACAACLLDPSDARLELAWSLPLGAFVLELDPISAWFLLPVALVPLLGLIYGHGYGQCGRGFRFCYGILAASLALLLAARDSVLFLIAWEGMALSAFFLVTSDDREREVRSAGWIYLIAAHVGTLALIAMFALFASTRGDTAIAPLGPASGEASAIFVLGLVGFGLKAGLMPLHVWLPSAHSVAPSHVSAVLSAVVTKMGIYGLVRLVTLLPAPPLSWGMLLVALGSVSAVAALAFALGQGDLKRLLAYSTIENVGVIVIALGIASVGHSLGEPALVALGLGGALLHVLAHALMKTLLFLSAGAVIHATGTRRLDRLGGLLRAMPRTAALFALGAVAIAALPPLAGFASELVIYLGLFDALHTPAPALLSVAAPVLALAGALALALFVRAFGAVFLGQARAEAARPAHECTPAMLWPMASSCLGILFIGLLPGALAPLLDAAVTASFGPLTTPLPPIAALVPFDSLSGVNLALLGVLALGVWGLSRLVRRRDAADLPADLPAALSTWDCGYAAPSARMQYTASSFASPLIGLFAWLVHPLRRRPRLEREVVFPLAGQHSEQVPDLVLDRLILPAATRAERSITRLRVLQQGRLHTYILYMLLAVIGLYLALGL